MTPRSPQPVNVLNVPLSDVGWRKLNELVAMIDAELLETERFPAAVLSVARCSCEDLLEAEARDYLREGFATWRAKQPQEHGGASLYVTQRQKRCPVDRIARFLGCDAATAAAFLIERWHEIYESTGAAGEATLMAKGLLPSADTLALRADLAALRDGGAGAEQHDTSGFDALVRDEAVAQLLAAQQEAVRYRGALSASRSRAEALDGRVAALEANLQQLSAGLATAVALLAQLQASPSSSRPPTAPAPSTRLRFPPVAPSTAVHRAPLPPGPDPDDLPPLPEPPRRLAPPPPPPPPPPERSGAVYGAPVADAAPAGRPRPLQLPRATAPSAAELTGPAAAAGPATPLVQGAALPATEPAHKRRWAGSGGAPPSRAKVPAGPPGQPMRIQIVSIAELTSPTQHFRCTILPATLSAGSCVKRQLDGQFYNCRDCDTGRRIAAQTAVP